MSQPAPDAPPAAAADAPAPDEASTARARSGLVLATLILVAAGREPEQELTTVHR